MHLLVKKDGKLLHRLDVTAKKPLILGRSKKCDMQLKDEKISRHHVKVTAGNKGLMFEDLQSRNGTYYKNVRIKTKELFSGQSIQVGDYHLQVENINTTEQKTMAMIQDDAATEVALVSEDLEILSEDAPQEPTRAAENPPSEAFMQAIAVSNAPAETLDDIAQDQASPTTTEVSQINQDVWDEPQSIADAPHASIADAIDQAVDSATYKEDELDPVDKPAKDKTGPADLQTEVMDNPVSSPVQQPETTKDPSTSNFFFSSMDSSPAAKVDEVRDVFTAAGDANKPPTGGASDTEQHVETGNFDAPPADSISSGRTEIRNFTAPPSVDPPETPNTPQKRKPLFLFLTAIAIGVGLLIIDEKDALFGSKSPASKTSSSTNSPDQKAAKSSQEDERLAMHLIEETQAALDVQDLDTAKEKMKILLETYPQTQSLQTFLPTYQQTKQTIEEEQAALAAQKQQEEDQINALLTKGKKLVDKKEFDAAKETFEKILSIIPDHPESLDWLTKAEELSVQEEYKDFAQKRRHQELDRIYQQGVEAFEAGQFGIAEDFLRTVSDDRTHPKARSADRLIKQIGTQTDSKLEQKIIQAKNKITSLATLPAGYQELKTITQQFPQRKDAQSYYKQAQEKMLEKAKQLYAEAIAQQELAGDYATALDLYQEVLTYAPDPNEEYHRKAKARIENLQL